MLNLKVDLARPEVCLPAADAWLYGDLVLPPGIQGLVLFAHGSGNVHHSQRCRQVARHLKHANIATLLFDLLIELRFGRNCEDCSIMLKLPACCCPSATTLRYAR